MKLRVAPLVAILALVALACGADVSETAGSTTTEAPVAVLPGGPALDATTLTVDHPCGFGFAKGSADQTLAIQIFFIGEWSEEGPPLDEPIGLGPDSEWTSRIRVGADLYANWCDDVIEEDEPTPRIDQEFEIVSGTLVASRDGQIATAVLRDVVARPLTDGDIVERAEIELRNNAWGVFAG